MQNDVLEIRIFVVAMSAPAAGFDIDFDIAGRGQIVAELNNRAMKIRAALAIEKTRMKNSDGSTVQCHQLIAEQALVLPDGLK
jgi:hypothetical protein